MTQKFCSIPFTSLHASYTNSTCCIGNADKQHYKKIYKLGQLWNCDEFVSLRKKILAGDYSSCIACYLHSKDRLPVATEDDLNRNVVLSDGPRVVFISTDFSCQLNCQSCRVNKQISNKHNIDIITDNTINLLSDALDMGVVRLVMCGNGEIFFSPVYANVLNWLETKLDHHHNIKIRVMTNGLRIPYGWKTWPKSMSHVDRLSISIDSCTQDIYESVRRGGKWSDMIRSLEFVSRLKETNSIKTLIGVFVVQRDNFRQMGDFVDFVKQYKFDTVLFRRLGKFGQDKDEFAERSIHLKSHPLHKEYIDITKDHRLLDPIVNTSGIY